MGQDPTQLNLGPGMVVHAFNPRRSESNVHLQSKFQDSQAQAVKELFHDENETKVIGIRHGEKMYETLLTNEECAHAVDMGNFYRVPADKRDLNYDKYFIQGNRERTELSEFNSNNTELMDVEQVKKKLMTLSYIQEEIAKWENR